MFSKFRWISGWVVGACLALAGAQAQAATVTHTVVIPQDSTDISGTATFPLFDTSLGTLTEVRIKSQLQVSGLIAVTLSRNAPAPKLIGVSGSTQITYGSSLSAVDSLISSQSTSTTYSTGSALKNPGETLSTSINWVQLGYTVTTLNAPGDLAIFENAGTFDIDYSTTTPGLTNIGSGGNLSYDQQTKAGVTLIVEYDYIVTGNPIDLTLSKTLTSTGPYVVGSSSTFNLAARNLGPSAAQPAIVVKDTLPSGLQFVSATGTDWSCSAAGQEVTCTRSAMASPLASGDAASPITVTAKVVAGASGALTNVAYVAPAADETAIETNLANGYDDGSPLKGSNNDASAALTVAAVAPPPPTPVPTLNEWALMLLGLLAWGSAAVRLRRGA